MNAVINPLYDHGHLNYFLCKYIKNTDLRGFFHKEITSPQNDLCSVLHFVYLRNLHEVLRHKRQRTLGIDVIATYQVQD